MFKELKETMEQITSKAQVMKAEMRGESRNAELNNLEGDVKRIYWKPQQQSNSS